MDLGNVLSTTVDTLRSRLLGLIGIWVVFFVLQIILVFVLGGALGLSAAATGAVLGDVDSGPGALGFGAGMFAGILVFYLIYIAIYCAQNLTMAHYASPLVQQDIGSSFGVGFQRMLTMLGVFILFIVAYFIVLLVFGILAAILGAVLGEAGGIVLAIIALPAFIYLACRLVMVWAVVAVDGIRNPVTAITRTWSLSGGHVLTIFLALLIFIIAAIVVFGLAIAAFYGVITGFQEAAITGEGPAVAGIITMVVVFALLGLAFAAAGSALFSAMHSKVTDMGTENLSDTFG